MTVENIEEELNPKLSESPEEEVTFLSLIPDQLVLEKTLALGFSRPTEVQAKAMPPANSGKDVVVQAQTGSGKTLAYAAPLLVKLNALSRDKEIRSTFGLIVAPTRELALQVREVITSISPEAEPVALIGGVDTQTQIKQLKKDQRIVVGTPGRILDLIRQRALKLNECRFFALDEADEMLSMGFLEDVRAILSRLPDKRQGMFVSATITPRVEMLAHSFLSKPARITVGDYTSEGPPITHYFCEVGADLMAKPLLLCDLVESFRPRSAIIFCNTKSDTQLVEALLRRRGFDARRINSDLTQSQRNRIMKSIREEELQLLVATDIAARGLDIEQIDLVVNYNIHEQPEIYIHRTGRTGRAGREGKAISLVGPRDIGSFHFLTKVLDVTFTKLPAPSDEELTDARLLHLYEMLRQTEIDVGPRDDIVSTKLLRELGNIEDPPEELVKTLSKLCRHTIEHFIGLEKESLEQELTADSAEEEQLERRPRREERDERRGRDRREPSRSDRRHDKAENREETRNRPRRREDDAPRERYESRRNSSDIHEERRFPEHKQDRGRNDRPWHENSTLPRDTEQKEPLSAERMELEEVRLYIGQGTAHAMTADLFRDLAMEFAELKAEDLRMLTIREHYGFVDIYREQAETLIGALNGIEYNGMPLPIERAATLTRKPQRRSSGPRRPRDDRSSNRPRHDRDRNDRRQNDFQGSRRSRRDQRR